MITDQYKADLQARVDLVDLIESRGIKLQKKGKEHSGICPFHDERTPSFYVNNDRGVFYCFSCCRGGDSITFLMDFEGKGFRDAIKTLADIAGVQLPEQGKTDLWRVRQDRQAAFFKSAMLALEPELYIIAIASSDNINCVKPSEDDRARYLQALGNVLRAIEEMKGRRLTEAERKHILGQDEYREQQQSEVAA